MKLRPPLSTTDRADLRQRAASRIMAADDFTLLQVAGPLGLLERPAGHDAGKPHTAQAYERHRSNQPEEAPMNGIESIAAERLRQIEVEGWTPERDDQHSAGEMAAAAAAYTFSGYLQSNTRVFAADPLGFWPWHESWWKPKSAREDLVRAGALIAAEIDRLDRAAKQASDS